MSAGTGAAVISPRNASRRVRLASGSRWKAGSASIAISFGSRPVSRRKRAYAQNGSANPRGAEPAGRRLAAKASCAVFAPTSATSRRPRSASSGSPAARSFRGGLKPLAGRFLAHAASACACVAGSSRWLCARTLKCTSFPASAFTSALSLAPRRAMFGVLRLWQSTLMCPSGACSSSVITPDTTGMSVGCSASTTTSYGRTAAGSKRSPRAKTLR